MIKCYILIEPMIFEVINHPKMIFFVIVIKIRLESTNIFELKQCADNPIFLPREEDGQWKEDQKLEAHSDWVRDVGWAPSIGLPTSTIASCSQVITAKCFTLNIILYIIVRNNCK